MFKENQDLRVTPDGSQNARPHMVSNAVRIVAWVELIGGLLGCIGAASSSGSGGEMLASVLFVVAFLGSVLTFGFAKLIEAAELYILNQKSKAN